LLRDLWSVKVNFVFQINRIFLKLQLSFNNNKESPPNL